MYAKHCRRKVDFFVMVDGVAKPIPIAYTRKIPAYNCVNYYQTKSAIQGSKIRNCKNFELYSKTEKTDFANTHNKTEWSGVSRGVDDILDYFRASEQL